MKKILIVFGAFCLIFSCGARAETKPFTLSYDRTYASPDTYKKQAQAWFDKHFAGASKTDLLLALNLVYTSWARSSANLHAQSHIEKARAALSDMAYSFALTRLTPGLYVSGPTGNTLAKNNPTNNTVLDTAPQTGTVHEHNALDTLDAALANHKNISRMHHYALEYIIDRKQIASSAALAGLVLMRRSARTTVAQALATVPRHIGDIITQTHAQLSDAIEKFSHQKLINLERRGAIDFLWKYIQRFFARAFVNSDKAYSHGWYACDQALLLSQSVHNALWRVMEEVRCAFYRAHYDVIYAALQKSAAVTQTLPETSSKDFCMLFDRDGKTSRCPKILPAPHSLSASFVLS